MDSARFDELLRLWQDGEASAEDLHDLEALLRSDPRRRRALAGAVLVEVNLYGRFGSPAAAPRPSPRRWRALERVAALLLMAVPALAVTYLLTRSEVPAPAAPGVRDRIPPGASYTLMEAVERVRGRVPGAAVSAVLEDEDGRRVFAVKIAQGAILREIELDPVTGAVLEDEVDAEDPTAIVAAAKISLAQAVRAALDRVPGAVLEAEMEIVGNGARVEIEIAVEGGRREVLVDAETGRVLKVGHTR